MENSFLLTTGIPMRKIAFMRRPFALADPVPLTVAILITTSFTLDTGGLPQGVSMDLIKYKPQRIINWPAILLFADGPFPGGRGRVRLVACMGNQDFGFLHIPCAGRASLGAKAAMYAKIFIFNHHASGLRQATGYEEILFVVLGRSRQAGPQIEFVAILGDSEAVDRANIEAGITLNAKFGSKFSLDVAIQAALDFLDRLLNREAQFDFDVELLESLLEIDVRHEPALG